MLVQTAFLKCLNVTNLDTIGHEVDIRSRGIVSPSIDKHQLHVIVKLLRLLVAGPIKLALDGGKVDRLGDDNGIILEDGDIHWLGKGESPLHSNCEESVK